MIRLREAIAVLRAVGGAVNEKKDVARSAPGPGYPHWHLRSCRRVPNAGSLLALGGYRDLGHDLDEARRRVSAQLPDPDSDDPKAKSQIWLLNRAGGEAERLTEMPGGVSRFEWSPDSTRLVIASRDPEDDPEEEDTGEDADDTSHDTPDPIVIDRFQFKQDRTGYLTDRYQRLYVFDVADREAALLTPGPFDNNNPVWSPDGELYFGQGSSDGGDSSYYFNNNASINLSAGNHFYTKTGSSGSRISTVALT